jgi:hypothetical protein
MSEASLCPFTHHRMQRPSSASLKEIISASQERSLFLVFLRRTTKKISCIKSSLYAAAPSPVYGFRLCLKRDDTRAETRFRLSTKRTSLFKSAGASVQSTTGSRGVRISGSYAGYTVFRGSVKGTGYPLHSPVSPSLPLPCLTVCHHISTGLCSATALLHKYHILLY